MGIKRRIYLTGSKVYTCDQCGTHLAASNKIISKVQLIDDHYGLYDNGGLLMFMSFQSSSGKAYLFEEVVNVSIGKKEDKQLRTGLHTVADCNCSYCGTYVGWFYVKAYHQSQKYKEGKYVLEKAMMSKLLDEYSMSFALKDDYTADTVDRCSDDNDEDNNDDINVPGIARIYSFGNFSTSSSTGVHDTSDNSSRNVSPGNEPSLFRVAG